MTCLKKLFGCTELFQRSEAELFQGLDSGSWIDRVTSGHIGSNSCLRSRGLIDPVAGLIDYTKNWQKRVKIFGLNASSSRRNRILLSIIAYFGLVFWHFLSHKTWYIELQQEFSTIAMSHGVVVLPE